MRKLAFVMSVTALSLTQSAFTCGPGIEPPGVSCPDRPAPAAESVEVGQMNGSTFERATSSQSYVLEFGSQGGQHTFVALRFYGIDGTEWAHSVKLVDDSGTEIGSRLVLEEACSPGWTIVNNVQVFLIAPGISGEVAIQVESGPVDAMGRFVRSVTTEGRIRLQ